MGLQTDHLPNPIGKVFPELGGCSETDQAQGRRPWRQCLLLGRTSGAPVNIFTARLPTTPGIIRIPFTHRHAARLIPLLPGLLELGGDHRRAGGSTARQRCCHPAPEETNREHFKHGGGGGICPTAVPAVGSDPLPHLGRGPALPESRDPAIPERRSIPSDGGDLEKVHLTCTPVW